MVRRRWNRHHTARYAHKWLLKRNGMCQSNVWRCARTPYRLSPYPIPPTSPDRPAPSAWPGMGATASALPGRPVHRVPEPLTGPEQHRPQRRHRDAFASPRIARRARRTVIRRERPEACEPHGVAGRQRAEHPASTAPTAASAAARPSSVPPGTCRISSDWVIRALLPAGPATIARSSGSRRHARAPCCRSRPCCVCPPAGVPERPGRPAPTRAASRGCTPDASPRARTRTPVWS